MNKNLIFNKIIFFVTGLIAGFKIISGMLLYSNLTTFYFTVAFGVLLLTCLLLLLLGHEFFANNYIAVIATLIPVFLSLGMVNNKMPEIHFTYVVIIGSGFLFSIFLRFYKAGKIASLSLAFIHGVSGLVIFFLPLFLLFNSAVEYQYGLVSIGAALIGSGGLLMSFIKGGKPILREDIVLNIFPTILFLTTLTLVIGFAV